MIPERSEKGKFATSVFFHDVNDIDIYIEDTAHGYEKIYNIIFSRIFKDKYNIHKVFSLGGRKPVIDAFQNQGTTTRPYLFIIDGDFSLALGDEIGNSIGLYKLPCYCIENILCDSHAFEILLDEEDLKVDSEKLKQTFNYAEWKLANEDKLFNLFVIYALIFKILPEIKTVTYPANKLVSSNNGMIDEIKLSERITNLKDSIVERIGSTQLDEEIAKLQANVLSQISEKLDIVSGKDYLYPLLRTRFDSTVDNRVSHSIFKLRLSKHCCLDKIVNCIEFVANE